MILDHMARETGLPVGKLATIVRTSDNRYMTYPVEKRGGGVRWISQPSKRLKFVQRWMVRRIFSEFYVHPSCTAYRTGAGIRHNAETHATSKYLLKLDFRNFFPSITEHDVRRLILDNIDNAYKYDAGDEIIVSNAVCLNGALTIGAPSSPVISNVILSKFDLEVNEYCEERKMSYTRYADDITISGNDKEGVPLALGVIRETLARMDYPRLYLNEDKTAYVSKKHRRIVTGLVLTSDNRVSVGRAKKRELKSLVFMFKNSDLERDKIDYLKGWISYVNSVEPDFIKALNRKYGTQVLDRLSDYRA